VLSSYSQHCSLLLSTTTPAVVFPPSCVLSVRLPHCHSLDWASFACMACACLRPARSISQHRGGALKRCTRWLNYVGHVLNVSCSVAELLCSVRRIPLICGWTWPALCPLRPWLSQPWLTAWTLALTRAPRTALDPV
jgi:hypothetical protein